MGGKSRANNGTRPGTFFPPTSAFPIFPMKKILSLLTLIGLFAGQLLAAEAKPNTLTSKEKSDGWKLLFDGKSLDGWKASEYQAAFSVEDGCIVTFATPGAGVGKKAHLF